MRSYFFTFITSILLSLGLCKAQTVGIVMNGGGAKGLYHIGVLEALEESGVPIDYAAGTSMGAIVAGLYAAGYSPAEIRELAVSGEINSWVTGYIDPNYGYYFRNNRSTLLQSNPMLSIRLDPNKESRDEDAPKGMGIPHSLISTTQIDMALSRLFTSANIASKGDFNNLMIPFLCIASDITAGQDTVYTKGDIGLAIRASMAIPLVYKPIIDERGHILFDGGIYNNFPLEDMQRVYNPDFIIGVSCTNDNIEFGNTLSLVDQAMILLTNRREAKMPENGMLIDRNVDVNMLDFSSADEVIKMGYDDTMLKMDSLMTYINHSSIRSLNYFEDRRKEFNDRKPELIVNSCKLNGLTPEQEQYVQLSFESSNRKRRIIEREQSDMSFSTFQRRLYKVVSTGEFNTDYPTIIFDDSTKKYAINMGMEYKPSLKLSLGGNLSSTPFNQIYLGFNYSSIKRVKKSINAELYLGPVYTTGRIGYHTEFYSYRPLFVNAYYNFASKNLQHGTFGRLTTVDNTQQIKYIDQYVSIGIGTPLLRRSYLQLRTNIGSELFNHDDSQYETTSQGTFDKTRFQYIATKLEVEKSTLDNLYYPSQGMSLSFSLIGILGSEYSYATQSSDTLATNMFKAKRSWIGAKINMQRYFRYSSNSIFSLGLTMDGIYTNIPDMYSQTTRQFLMPSFQPIVHSKMVYMPEYSAYRYVAVGAIPSIRLLNDLSLRGEIYAMLRDRYIDPSVIEPTTPASDELKFSIKYISQASLIYKSNIGSMSLAVTKYNISDWNNMYLTFNFGHTIFSPRGTFD